MTIDRQPVVYFINEKGGLALAAEIIHFMLRKFFFLLRAQIFDILVSV